MATKGIIYYSGGGVPDKVAVAVREQLLTLGLPIVSCTLEPLDFGTNVVIEGSKGYLTMFRQILAALEASTTEVVFFCEHDNLMHPSHFDFTPTNKDTFYYDLNWYKTHNDGTTLHWDAAQVSGLCCYRQLAIDFYKERINSFNTNNFDRKFEPSTKLETWWAEYPSVDVRGSWNLTYNKKSISDFRDKSTAKNFHQIKVEEIPGWNLTVKDIYG